MLSSLEIEDFRCIERAQLAFDVRATGIVGPNASGKTSLLEAIYFLGHGRSFRIAQRDKLIRHGAGFLRLVGRLDPDGAGQRAAVGGHFRPDSGHSPNDRFRVSGQSAPEGMRTPVCENREAPPIGAREIGPSSESADAGAPAELGQAGLDSSMWVRDSVGRCELGGAGQPVIAGVQYQPDRLEVRLAGRPVSGFSEIAALLPIQVIDPGVHRLIEEGSARRRRLLDWGVFHVKHDFLTAWRRYQRALIQRNAALRAAASLSMITVWDAELSACAQLLDDYRAEYLNNFRDAFRTWAGRLVGPLADIEYRRGWRSGVTLEEALAESRARDQRVRTTTVGPHRADLLFTLEGGSARDRISRGQQKMLASAFVLAQVALRATQEARPTCLLLDDPAAELDVDNLGKLLGALAEIPAQLIVTAVSEAGLRGLPVGRTFHVEQGKVR